MVHWVVSLTPHVAGHVAGVLDSNAYWPIKTELKIGSNLHSVQKRSCYITYLLL